MLVLFPRSSERILARLFTPLARRYRSPPCLYHQPVPWDANRFGTQAADLIKASASGGNSGGEESESESDSGSDNDSDSEGDE